MISTLCENDDSLKAYAFRTGDFVSKKTVVDSIKNDERFVNPFLGGQNHYTAFAEKVEEINASNISTHDEHFVGLFRTSLWIFFSYIDSDCSFDEAYNRAMKSFVENAKSEGFETSGCEDKFTF
jgi:hypothetical protein